MKFFEVDEDFELTNLRMQLDMYEDAIRDLEKRKTTTNKMLEEKDNETN